MQTNTEDSDGGSGNPLWGQRLRPTGSITPVSDTAEHPIRSSKSRRRLACRNCRQAKIKCDPSRTPAGRCKRCLSRNEECLIDENFQRVHKKQAITQLQEQIDRLNAVLGKAVLQPSASSSSENPNRNSESRQPSPLPPSFLQTPTGLLFDTTPLPPLGGHGQTENVSPVATRNPISREGNPDVSLPRRIGDVRLDGEVIDQLFKIYFECYDPFIHLLDCSMSPNEYYNDSVLLFWSIISVASRHYESPSTLVTALAEPVKALLWKGISTLPHKLQLVQAIVLITNWSFATSSMHTSPTFMLISIARASALTLGLHRPETIKDYLRIKTRLNPTEIQAAIKTWVECYITAQCITSQIGQPPLFTSDWAIDRACQPGNIYNLSEDTRHRLLIQQFSSYATQVMSENRRNTSGLPSENEITSTLALLENSFGDLERQLEGNLSTINQIWLCCASLQLRSFYFFETSPNHRQRGILKTYATALQLVNITEEATQKSGFMLYVPPYFGYITFTVGVTILKILNSSLSAFIDIDEGKRTFYSVITLLLRMSIAHNDLQCRGSKILAQLLADHDPSSPGQGDEPTLSLNTRSSASVLHEALWTWRERFAIDPEASLQLLFRLHFLMKQLQMSQHRVHHLKTCRRIMAPWRRIRIEIYPNQPG